MALSNFQVTGGKIGWDYLTLELFKKDRANYEAAKAFIWMRMLNDRQKPKRWLKPNKNGTAVHFTILTGPNDYEVAIGELQGHINVINREYHVGLKLDRTTDTNTNV